ncbi:hypothetical protein DYB30_011768 [Aphanomyces astaci]|uniref:Metalloendopeptidase n=2 Tax=Aphanomyces astaci TaxID=112090 RepID=A0A397AZT2_APHAT|nr:hypothetical protein DYB36_008861 [Aphanomyces astaci]RHY44540.1 hypothetical protein DYB38_011389 [Aphanomyces astaci]RHY47508.1 hypothetical protein DYB30_011768 [Aphanomyces astaci]RHZ10135.1 hypothetical protein DYB26_012432 [Aphanomyces astaci]
MRVFALAVAFVVAVDAFKPDSNSCVTEEAGLGLGGEYMHHKQAKYVIGEPYAAGSYYRYCFKGKLTCHRDAGIADLPMPKAENCSEVLKKRKLGYFVDPQHTALWPHQTLCYGIKRDDFSDSENKIIDDGLTYLRTTGLTFLTLDECKAAPNADKLCGGCVDYVHVNKKDPNRCSARVGWAKIGPQPLNLGTPCFVVGKGTVVHEFLHSLGVFHEHTNPSANLIVHDMQRGAQNYLPKAQALYTDYDSHSIMHYPQVRGVCIPLARKDGKRWCGPHESKSLGCVEPRAKDCDVEASKPFGQRKKMSQGDFATIANMYGCAKTGKNATIDFLRNKLAKKGAIHNAALETGAAKRFDKSLAKVNKARADAKAAKKAAKRAAKRAARKKRGKKGGKKKAK